MEHNTRKILRRQKEKIVINYDSVTPKSNKRMYPNLNYCIFSLILPDLISYFSRYA